MRNIAILLFVFSLAGLHVMVHAQNVYRCQTADGRMVFQQMPCGEGEVAGDTEAQKLWREMHSLAGRGNHIISELGSTSASIAECRDAMDVFEKQLQALRPRVNQVSRQHPDLSRALGALQDCAHCRTSAASNCMLASRYLDRAMSKLTEY